MNGRLRCSLKCRGFWPWVTRVLVLLAYPSLGLAQPVIHSAHWESHEGAILKLEGTGFGSRSDHSPSLNGFLAAAWHDFDDGNVDGGGWNLDGTPEQWTVVSGGRTPNGFSVKKVYQTNEYGSLTHTQSDVSGTWFCSFWMKVADPQQSGKFFRWYAGSPTNNIYLSTGGIAAYPAVDKNLRGLSECSGCSPTPSLQWTSPNEFTPNTWHRIDITIRESPDEFSVYMDGRLQWSKRSTINQQWVKAPSGANGHTIHVGAALNGPGKGYPAIGEYNFDDVYLDYTVARVELCESAEWNSCFHREIQPARYWTGNAIEFKFNAGSFSPGTTAYLFVVDSSGRTSNPISIVIPADSPTAPLRPTNVRVGR